MIHKLSIYWQALAVCIAAISCTSSKEGDFSEAPPAIQKLPVDVKVVRYTPQNQEEIVTGSILPNREVAIMSEVSKRIVSIHFKDGSTITKGQLLFKLDDADIQARLKQVQAELSLAVLNESRLSQLLGSESVRQEEYDIAKVKVQSLLAAEELLKVELGKTSIHAPFSGQVGISQVHEGAIVNPGATLVTLQDQSTVKIQFTVPEKYYSNVREGEKIYFTPTFSSERLQGVIVASESSVNQQSRTILMQASYPNSKGLLKPGMSVRVHYSIRGNEKSFAIPTESLIPGANGYAVFLVKNGAAKVSSVTISNRTDSEALITSGLAEGDTVMISNILRTGEGVPVQVVSSK